MPGTQGKHAEALVAPMEVEKVPSGQKPSQKAWPGSGWKVPAPQRRQEARPAMGL